VPASSTELALFLNQCASPPNGRLVPIVLAQLSLETHTAQDEINKTLFPPRR
jgi:hypothetical protein